MLYPCTFGRTLIKILQRLNPSNEKINISTFNGIYLIRDNRTKIINVKQFGAKGNVVSNDTKAIQRAIDYLPSDSMVIIYFPTGIYNISSYVKTQNYLENFCINLHSNLSFVGDGANSILRIANHLFDIKDTASNAHLFYGSNVKNISFSNFVVDMNGSKNLVPQNVIKNHSAIFCNYGENFKINNLTIKNCSGTNMLNIMGRGKNLLIENCQFINGGNYVGDLKPNKTRLIFLLFIVNGIVRL